MTIQHIISTVALVSFTIGLICPANAFLVTDCSGKEADGKIDSVSISTCPTKSGDYCNLIRGQNASIEIKFDSINTFSSANVQIWGIMGIFPVNFPVNPKEACGNYGLQCPVKANETETFKLNLPVSRSYPKMSLKIQLQLTDENKKTIVCILFPAKIIDPQSDPNLIYRSK